MSALLAAAAVLCSQPWPQLDRYVSNWANCDGLASWLPFWHVGNILPPAATQCDLFLMTPVQFLQDPAAWLRCLGRLSCTVTFSPSFGYLHVLNTVTSEAVADCRFDDWRVAVVVCGMMLMRHVACPSYP